MPWIFDRAKMGDTRRSAISELMQVQFPQQDSAGFLQSPNNFRIFQRHAVCKHRAGGCSADSRRIDQIFQRDRDAMQRSAPFVRERVRLPVARLVERIVLRNRNERVDQRIRRMDLRQTSLREFRRRQDLSRTLADASASVNSISSEHPPDMTQENTRLRYSGETCRACLKCAGALAVFWPSGPEPARRCEGVGNFSHIVSNLDKSIEFYRDVLGLELTAPPAPFAANPAIMKLGNTDWRPISHCCI